MTKQKRGATVYIVQHTKQKRREIFLQYKIREKRELLNMSQTELSKKSGVSRTIISGLESGSIEVTTTETLLKIANALGCSVKEIFFE